jgi:hypothetical protein
MLFKQIHLEGIRERKVTLAYRRWKKASVKPGSLIKTAVGLVEIQSVAIIEAEEISEDDARKAGFDSLAALVKMLHQYPEGDFYKIEVRHHAADPRIGLREQNTLPEEAYQELKTKLQRMDHYSSSGPWTMNILAAIKANPKLRAADLALQTGKEKDWLKPNIRKLKNLGLTISHHPGYELSPLGTFFLRKWERENKSKK